MTIVKGFVRPSARFSSEIALAKLIIPPVIPLQTRISWQERCFFLIFEAGEVVFKTPDMLLPTSVLVCSKQRPIQQSLYHNLIMKLIAVCEAITSEPKVEVSTVRCC